MKSSKFLCICALVSSINLAAWADTIKITIVRDDTPTAAIPASADYTVVAGQSRAFDNMQTLEFSPTSGDCSIFGISSLRQQAKSGEILRLGTTAYEGFAIVQIAFEQRKFLGTKPVKFNQSCTVNFANSNATEFEQTVSLRAGEQPILLRSLPGFKMFGALNP